MVKSPYKIKRVNETYIRNFKFKGVFTLIKLQSYSTAEATETHKGSAFL
jgi:hypothetical protein